MKSKKVNNNLKAICLTTILVILLLLIGLLRTGNLCAQNVPKRIRYIAVLANPGGEPVSGTFTAIVRMYDSESGGEAVFTEQHDNILITKRDMGAFYLDIGSHTPLEFTTFTRSLWMTLEIINEYGHSSGEFAPRTRRVLSAGYTLNTDAIDANDSEGFLRSDTDDILDGDVTITGSLISLGGFINPENVWILGTTFDSWTIDMSQDAPDRIALI